MRQGKGRSEKKKKKSKLEASEIATNVVFCLTSGRPQQLLLVSEIANPLCLFSYVREMR
jgi:hypothetical protein